MTPPTLVGSITVGVLLLAALLMTVRSLNLPVVHDIPIMNYIAWRVLLGEVPYRDVFDMNFPGTYLLHMFALTVFGTGDRGWYLFSALFALFSAFTLALLSVRLGRWAALIAGSLWLCFYYGLSIYEYGQRDFMMLPFLAFGAHAFGNWLEKQQHKLDLLLAGFWVGCAGTVKPFAFFLLALFGLVYLGVAFCSRVARQAFPRLAWLLIGGTVAPVGALLWLLALGGLPSFLELLAGFLMPVYSSIQTPESVPIPLTLARAFLWILPGLVLAFWATRASHSASRYMVLSICTFYGALHFLAQGKGWPYHLFPFYFFAIGLTALGIGEFLQRPQRRLQTTALLVLLLFSFAMLWQLARRSVEDVRAMIVRPNVEHLLQQLPAYNLTPDDRVQVLDATSGGIQLLYILRIPQPSRFIYDVQFFSRPDDPVIQSLRQEFLQDLRVNPPKLILVFDGGQNAPYSIDRLQRFPELLAFLEENYNVSEETARYTVFALTPSAKIGSDPSH